MVDKLAANEINMPVELIFQIHQSSCKAVLAITGGGAEIIGELLHHGSGSATVLEAVVPYSTDAMDRFLGRKPEKYCSDKTARLMAMVAYQRALELSKANEFAVQDIIGIGATCKLKSANEREGRKHEIHVAIQAACKTEIFTLELTVDRTREEEEKIAALLIFNVLARHCGVPEIGLPDVIGTRNGIWNCTGTGHDNEQDSGQDRREEIIKKCSSVSEEVGSLLMRKSCSPESYCITTGIARISLKGVNAPEEIKPEEIKPEKMKTEEIKLVFSGSFDPCHRNHIFMAKLASGKLNSPVHFEISLTNVDKPPIDFISLNQRLDSLREHKNEAFMGGICLTNAPLFLQKADLFPNSTFIIGADTFNRLFDAKYYGGAVVTPDILKLFKEKNIHFLVFHRKSVELCINPEALEFCEIIPMDEYEDDGISSTKIRKKQEHRNKPDA